MVRIAKEDTYAIEHVGGGIEVRRRVVAGQSVPDHYELQGVTEEVDNQAAGPDYGDHTITGAKARRGRGGAAGATAAPGPVGQETSS